MSIPALPRWKDDGELFALMRQHLFSAVIGDVLDRMGHLRQFLPAPVRAIDPAMVVAGRAMPVLEADYFGDEGFSELSRRPFGRLFEALDDLKPHEVYLAAGGSPRYALWGGLMTTRARALGAAGAVLDGYHRDTAEILERQFPTFSLGAWAQDQGPRGKVVDWRVPIEFGGVRVRPGDIVFGDRDGVLVIPRAAEDDAIRLAWQKVHTESQVRIAIENGMSTVEAFRTFGVM